MNHSNELSWTTSTQNDGQSSSKETTTLLAKSKRYSSQADTKNIIIDEKKYISLMTENGNSRFEEFFNCKLEFNLINPHTFEPRVKLTFNDEKDLMMFILRYM